MWRIPLRMLTGRAQCEQAAVIEYLKEERGGHDPRRAGSDAFNPPPGVNDFRRDEHDAERGDRLDPLLRHMHGAERREVGCDAMHHSDGAL